MTTIRAFSTSPAKRWGMFSRRYVMMPMAATWALIIGLQAGRLSLSAWMLMAGIVGLMAFELCTFIVPLARS